MRPRFPAAALAATLMASALASPAAAGRKLRVRVLDSEGAPVPDAVVFPYEQAPGPAPLHPSVMDQVDKEFVPHLLVVPIGAKVRFPNKDDIHHHLYSFSSAKTFDLPLYKGEPAAPILFDKPGVVKVGCNIHDWMNGIVLVLPGPAHARTDASGKATLELPSGSSPVEVAVFHERMKGDVESTRKSVGGAAAPASWTLPLKPARKSRRPAATY